MPIIPFPKPTFSLAAHIRQAADSRSPYDPSTWWARYTALAGEFQDVLELGEAGSWAVYAALSRTARCPGGHFSYRKVGLVALESGATNPRMISVRAQGVRRVLEVWDRLYAGKTEACAYAQIFNQVQDDALRRNQAAYAELHDDLKRRRRAAAKRARYREATATR